MKEEETIRLIRDLAKKHDIKAYDIGNNTKISLTTARNVLEETGIIPRKKTLNIILNYLENSIQGTKGNLELNTKYTTAAESPEEYKTTEFSHLKIDDKLNILFKQLTIINETLAILVLDVDDLATTKAKTSNK